VRTAKIDELNRCENFSKEHFAKGKRYKKISEGEGSSKTSNQWVIGLLPQHEIFEKEALKLLVFVMFNDPFEFSTRFFGLIRAESSRFHYGSKDLFESSGGHFAYILQESQDRLLDSVRRFGISSGLFDNIKIDRISAKDSGGPFAIKVVKGGTEFYIDELGYGVGQILPIITDLFANPGLRRMYLIQQPEVHLHPRAQAALGDLFYDVAKDGVTIVAETHSDFIIDRYRRRMMQGGQSVSSQVCYFDSNYNMHEISLGEDGSIEGAPDGYRDFFVREQMDNFEAIW
jgi:hypothetical protein